MNNLVEEFMSNIDPDCYHFINDEFRNTTKLQLSIRFFAQDIFDTEELEKFISESPNASYDVKRHVTCVVVRNILDFIGISNEDILKLNLVKDIPIEDILKLKSGVTDHEENIND